MNDKLKEHLEIQKKQIELEKKKLSEMTIKEKLDYIWEYYKYPIVGIIFVAALVGSIINNVFINPPKNVFAHMVFYNDYVSEETSDGFSDKLTEHLITDKEEEQILITYLMISQDDLQASIAMSQKFVAMIASKEIDLIISERSDFEIMCTQGYFLELNKVLSPKELAGYSDRLMTGTIDGEEGSYVYGIRMDDNPLFDEFRLRTDDRVLSIIASSDRVENASAAIRYIFEEK